MSFSDPSANTAPADIIQAYIFTNKDWGIARSAVDNNDGQDWVLYHGTVFFVHWRWIQIAGQYSYHAINLVVPMQGMQNGNWKIKDQIMMISNPFCALLYNNCERVSSYNCSHYGLCKNGGSYYSLRGYCEYLDGSLYGSGIKLVPGADKPVFGYGKALGVEAYAPDNGWLHLSTDGWIDGKGVYHSCSGLYASLYVLTHPSNYIINTY
ncbi:hypothetical protein OSC52_12575 [Clostridium pasteurianum]|uniref:hypothetical protein n=1 Tax=Clostridium pasteurianum TaxID=1501 RepID=UPI002260940C|nr:hypothetical protein [Clostridium pasteurianum]UZW12688.1 hypothetical protein OSC52_12575 [Clostridium pasteurianum]